jgi:deoxyribodipyrimidine photolyase
MKRVLHWFGRDLRITDNTPLYYASKDADEIALHSLHLEVRLLSRNRTFFNDNYPVPIDALKSLKAKSFIIDARRSETS